MKLWVVAAAAVLGLGAGNASAGTLTGNATIGYLYNNGTAWSGSNTVAIVPGVDLTCNPGGTGACGKVPGVYTFDLGGNTINFQQTVANATGTMFYTADPLFNGYTFTNLNFGEAITSVLITSLGIPGLDQNRVSFTSNSVFVNLQGLQFAATNAFTLTLNPQTAPTVPVPAALPLLLSGLCGLGFASRRKRGSISPQNS